MRLSGSLEATPPYEPVGLVLLFNQAIRIPLLASIRPLSWPGPLLMALRGESTPHLCPSQLSQKDNGSGAQVVTPSTTMLLRFDMLPPGAQIARRPLSAEADLSYFVLLPPASARR